MLGSGSLRIANMCAVQGRRPTFDDLRTVDEDVHRNLITVKRCGPHALLGCCLLCVSCQPFSEALAYVDAADPGTRVTWRTCAWTSRSSMRPTASA